jgi:hypothetical protein
LVRDGVIGVGVGIDRDGALLLLTRAGITTRIVGGEITIKE